MNAHVPGNVNLEELACGIESEICSRELPQEHQATGHSVYVSQSVQENLQHHYLEFMTPDVNYTAHRKEQLCLCTRQIMDLHAQALSCLPCVGIERQWCGTSEGVHL